jgi:hypothetical protein
MTRTLDYENWWGDDGDTLVVFGHVDRDELAAAAEVFGREAWGLDAQDFALVGKPEHQYAVLTTNDADEPWLYYQTEPEHPGGFDVAPITIASACRSLRLPPTADVPEPTTCVCPSPRPDHLGECAGCRRLVAQ